MPVLTIYNCGTAFDHNREDVIPELYNATTSTKLITDGVGSKAKVESVGGWRKLAENALTGSAFGVGVDANVNKALSLINALNAAGPAGSLWLNLCGWSRGAVTCFKISNRMQQTGLGHIPVRIFAIDPVPGSAGAAGRHMWKNIELTGNVKSCVTILCEHERRREFRPVLSRYFFDPDRKDDFVWDIMPGNHSGIVKTGEVNKYVFFGKHSLSGSYEVVRALAVASLKVWGTNFLGHVGGEVDSWYLDRYAGIMLNLSLYRREGKLLGVIGFRIPVVTGFRGRTIHAQNKKGAPLPKTMRLDKQEKRFRKLRFFVNNHHAGVFARNYPRLFSVFTQASEGFTDDVAQIQTGGTAEYAEYVAIKNSAPYLVGAHIDAYLDSVS